MQRNYSKVLSENKVSISISKKVKLVKPKDWKKSEIKSLNKVKIRLQ